MKTRRSRVLTAVLLLCFLFNVFSVAAELNLSQVLEIRVEQNKNILQFTQPVTLWESPNLKAGETLTKDGTFTILNSTEQTHSVELKEIMLPYDDPLLLQYLNHLQLSVSDVNGRLLYEGPYSRVNQPITGLVLFANLKPKESVSYTIRLSCDYSIQSPTGMNGEVITWAFRFTDPEALEAEDPTFDDSNITLFFWGTLIASLLLIGFILLRFRKHHKQAV